MENPIFTVTLPDIGEGVHEGEVISWLKQVGDPIAQDEPVVVVMTDKATVELPAPKPGTLAKQHYKAGETAIKGKPLYDIELASASAPPPKDPKKVKASPAVRKLAKDLAVDLSTIKGSGPDGIITKEDLEQKKPSKEEIPLTGIPYLMAMKMIESHKLIPQFTYFEQFDATHLMRTQKKMEPLAEKEGIKLTLMPYFIRAFAMAAKKFPLLNSSYNQETNLLTLHKQINLGIAMATPYGLIVPNIKNAGTLSLEQIIRVYADLKLRAFSNKLDPSDMKGGTLSITNFGTLSGHSVGGTPLINHPETAILGIAKIMKQPKVINNEIAVRDMTTLCFSFDHRVIDGSLGAQIASYTASLLEKPAELL